MSRNKVFALVRPRGLAALLMGVFLLARVGPVRAGDNLRLELGALAQEIKDLLDKEKQDAIAVGEFTGPAHLPSSGALIRKTLTEELEKLGVTVKSNARNFEVKGDFRDALDPQTQPPNLMGVKLIARVVDAQGEDVVKFPARIVHGNTELAVLLGVTVDLTSQGDRETRNQKIQDAVKDPKGHGAVLDGNRVRAAADSPYALEVRVKDGKDYVPRAPVIDDKGLAFVPLKREEVYEVVLVNESPYEAAVQLTVDSLSLFVFSEVKDPKTGQPRYTHVICSKGAAAIEGWHINNQKTDEFRITEYAHSAAAEVKSTGEVGTITATFAAAWPRGNDDLRPTDEPKSRSADIATGRGARIDKEYQEVERDFGVVRATVSVRYVK